MTSATNHLLLAATLIVLCGCARSGPAPAEASADEAAIRAINPVWFKAYSSGDVDGVTALYAEDAVINIPGAPFARGSAAIRAAMEKDVATMALMGLAMQPGASPEFGVSGDLGWEWNTFSVTNQSGATVDTGKYVTVYGRKAGKWLIVRDIWNTDTPPPMPGSAAPAPGVK